MTTSIRMNGSKNKADTRSIHLLVRLFSVPKSSHAISPFIFIRLGQLLHPSCGFRTHLYSLQSGNCIALANVLQKASLQTPFTFWEDWQQQGKCPLSGHYLYHPQALQHCWGGGESIFICHFLSNPANEASLRATWASEGGNTKSGGRQRPCRSINQSIYKCIHAHPVTKYFSKITQCTWKYIRSFFTLTKKQPDHGLLRRIMTIRVAGIVGLLDGYHCDKQDDNVGFWGHCHTADWSPFVHNHSLCSSEQVSWVSLFGILVCSEVGITIVTAQSMVFLGLTYFYDGSYAGESVS